MRYKTLNRIATLILLTVMTALVTIAQNAPLAKAKHLFAAGSYEQARQLLESSLKTHPHDPGTHLLLAQIYTIQDRRADAIQEFTKSIELNPNSATTYNMLGTALNRFAEFDQARKAFEEAIALDPQLAQAHINLAMSFAQAGNMSGTTEQLHAALSLKPDAPTAATAHYLLAKVYNDQNPRQAIDELTTAVKIQPDYQEAWLALGKLRSEVADTTGALSAFLHAVACDPHDAESQYELGSEYLAQGDANNAVTHLQLARKAMPRPTVALLYKLDRALRVTGNVAEAQQVRAEAQAFISQDTHANQHFQEAQTLEHDGVELESKGETEKALAKYRAALELNPQQDGFRLNYGLALCRLNRWQQGIAELNEILLRDPSNAEARRAVFIAQDKAKQASAARP